MSREHPEIRTDAEAEAVHKKIRRKVKLAARHLNEALDMCRELGYDPCYLNGSDSMGLYSADVVEYDRGLECPLHRDEYLIVGVSVDTFTGPFV